MTPGNQLDRLGGLDRLPGAEAMARVLIVHDQQLLALGLRALLREASGGEVAVVGLAARDELDDVVGRLRPNLVLVCTRPGTDDGLDTVRALRSSWPEVPVVIECPPHEASLAVTGVRAGAAGVVSTDADPATVVSALLTVVAGMAVIPPWLVDALGPVPPLPLPVRLSDEEQHLWRLLTRGWSNDAIAHALHLSVRTLKRRICLLLAKLAVANRVEAAALGGRLGLLDEAPRTPARLAT